MSGNGSGRNRGIRLSDEAIRLIESRMDDLWRQQNRLGKLTRQGKAELLHLSEKTVDRVLRGERVDRATIKQAVLRLNLEWSESLIVTEPAETEPETPTEAHPRRRRLPILPVAAATLAIASLGYWGGSRLSAPKVEPTPNWRQEFFDRLAKGTERYQKGDYARAKTEFDAVLKLAQTHDDLSGKGEALRMLADIDMAQGRFEAARDGYAAALDCKEKTGQSSTYPAIQEALGLAELKLKNYPAAKQWLRKALDGFLAANDLGGMAIVQRDLGTLAVAQRDLEGALAWFASARSGMGRATNTGLLMDIRAQEALVYLELGDVEKADQMLTDCLKFWEREKHPRWVSKTKLQLSKVKLARGLRAEAVALVSEAEKGFGRPGDRSGMAETRSLSN